MQAHSPFGKCCCRSGNLQGEEADSWDKREYCKAAVAFFLWPSQRCQDHYSEMLFLRDSSLMIQANLKLHQQWKGSLTLTQHVVLPRMNTEGTWLKVNQQTTRRNHNKNTSCFQRDHWMTPALTNTEDKNTQGSKGRRSTDHEGWMKKVTEAWSVKNENSPQQFFTRSTNVVFG